MTTEELLAIKEHVIENLYKGFIKPSLALYVASILFIYKPDRSLRFYINFRKLN